MEKIKATKRGDMVTATIEGEVMKKALTPENYEIFKEKVKEYNTKPTKKILTVITKLMTPEKEAKIAKKEAVRTEIKKAEKKAVTQKEAVKTRKSAIQELTEDLKKGKVSATDLAKLEALISKNKKVEDATPPPVPTKKAYGGEH